MQRSAVSIASNIAEGSERGGRTFHDFFVWLKVHALNFGRRLISPRKIGLLSETAFPRIISEVKELATCSTAYANLFN